MNDSLLVAHFIRDCMELAHFVQIKSILHVALLRITAALAFSKVFLLKVAFLNHSRFEELILY